MNHVNKRLRFELVNHDARAYDATHQRLTENKNKKIAQPERTHYYITQQRSRRFSNALKPVSV